MSKNMDTEKTPFPNCTGDCEFKINCGRFDDKKIIFYCLKNKCIYQKKKKKVIK